jgi:peptidoglycan/xylan/chitin deacetylase (PgdA/CDA1 family)
MMISAINKLYSSARRIITHGKPITIIRYHSISNISDSYTISPKAFLLQAEFISKKYNVARLKQIKNLFSINNDDKRTVIFTFDDAYSDFFEIVYPILDKFSISCTVFIPSGFIGKYNEWDIHLSNYKRRPIMTSRQLIDLKKKGFVDFGSHSVHHRSMANLSMSEMKKQAVESKKTLEYILDSPITMFSYPFGHFSKVTREILLESQYDIAVTSRWGTLNTSRQILNLNRIYLSEGDTNEDILAKIEGQYDIYYTRALGFKLSSYTLNKITTT